MKLVAAACIVLAVLAFTNAARAQDLTPGDPALLDAATKLVDPTKTAVAVIDLALAANAIHGHNLDTDWPPASCIKLSALVTAYQRAHDSPGFLDEKVTVARSNYTDTWAPPGDKRPLLRGGEVRTVFELIDLMITRSDNVATNQMVDVLGRARINATMEALGFTGIAFRHKLSGGAVSVSDPDALPGRNVMHVRSVALLLAGIARRTLVSKEASEAMEKHLLGQLDTSFLRRGLPSEVKLAWKSGVTSEVSNAAGIARGPGRAYVIVCFTKYSEGMADAPSGPMTTFARAVDRAFTGTKHGAWPVTHAWTDRTDPKNPASPTYIDAFRQAAATDARSRVERGEKWQPAELPLHVVIRFAEDKGLEVSLSAGGKEVSSKDTRFGSLDDFLAVTDTMTPADLVASSDETASPEAGDFLTSGEAVTLVVAPGKNYVAAPAKGGAVASVPAPEGTARRFKFLATTPGFVGAIGR